VFVGRRFLNHIGQNFENSPTYKHLRRSQGPVPFRGGLGIKKRARATNALNQSRKRSSIFLQTRPHQISRKPAALASRFRAAARLLARFSYSRQGPIPRIQPCIVCSLFLKILPSLNLTRVSLSLHSADLTSRIDPRLPGHGPRILTLTRRDRFISFPLFSSRVTCPQSEPCQNQSSE
jgi:hypothetical protein